MTSTGAAAGFFQGVVDEVRIWNVARSLAEIQADQEHRDRRRRPVSSGCGTSTRAAARPPSTSPAAATTGRSRRPPRRRCGSTGFDVTNAGVQLNGSSQYVTFGAAAGTASWARPRSPSSCGSSGPAPASGRAPAPAGIASAIPLITKGRAEAETPANLNMNYFLGIDATTGTLVADFEDTASGGNHPVTGTAVVTSNVWHHAAATYSGSTWQPLPRRRPRPDARSGRPRSCPRRPASSTPASAAR